MRTAATDRKHVMPSENRHSIWVHTPADPKPRRSGRGTPDVIVGAKATDRSQPAGRGLQFHLPQQQCLTGYVDLSTSHLSCQAQCLWSGLPAYTSTLTEPCLYPQRMAHRVWVIALTFHTKRQLKFEPQSSPGR